MNEVEAVARAVAPMMEGGREFDQMPPTRLELRQWSRSGMCSTNDATQDDATELAQAAIATLDAVRGDQVARVVEWLRKENGLCDCHAHSETECGCGAWDDWKTKPLLEIADAIERGEPFNG